MALFFICKTTTSIDPDKYRVDLYFQNKDFQFINQLSAGHVKHEQMTMSDEIETLRAKKETLKEELQVEGQKEESLQEDIEILQEKIAIRSLEKELDTKRESVKQLESRKSELQGEWNQPAQDTRKDEESKEPSSEPTIIVMPAQTPESVESQESDAQKKRRWF